MILGLGIDLVDLKRIKTLMNDALINRVLSKEELEFFHTITAEKRKVEYLGGRFAAKEAIFKAISKGPGNTNYTDFTILNNEDGKPYVKSDRFNTQDRIHLSISHTDDYAEAYVIIERI